MSATVRQQGQSVSMTVLSVNNTVRVGVGDSLLVGERRDCLVEAIAWYEASVVGRSDGQQQYRWSVG